MSGQSDQNLQLFGMVSLVSLFNLVSAVSLFKLVSEQDWLTRLRGFRSALVNIFI